MVARSSRVRCTPEGRSRGRPRGPNYRPRRRGIRKKLEAARAKRPGLYIIPRKDDRWKRCAHCETMFRPVLGHFDRTVYCSKRCRDKAAHARREPRGRIRGQNRVTKLRAEALERYGTTCVLCKKTKRAIRVLVRVPKQYEQTVENAVVICHRCNGRFMLGKYNPVKRQCEGGKFARYSRRALGNLELVRLELEARHATKKL